MSKGEAEEVSFLFIHLFIHIDKVVFTPARNWIGHERSEKIGDDMWVSKIYEVSGFDLKISTPTPTLSFNFYSLLYLISLSYSSSFIIITYDHP